MTNESTVLEITLQYFQFMRAHSIIDVKPPSDHSLLIFEKFSKLWYDIFQFHLNYWGRGYHYCVKFFYSRFDDNWDYHLNQSVAIVILTRKDLHIYVVGLHMSVVSHKRQPRVKIPFSPFILTFRDFGLGLWTGLGLDSGLLNKCFGKDSQIYRNKLPWISRLQASDDSYRDDHDQGCRRRRRRRARGSRRRDGTPGSPGHLGQAPGGGWGGKSIRDLH